ncbi:hypothetical protein [Anaerosporobacter sp.]
MKDTLNKTFFYGFSAMLALIFIDILKGREIDILWAIVGGIIMGMVDLILTLLRDKFKKGK